MFVTPLRKGLLALGTALCLLFVNSPVSAGSHIITFDVPRARTEARGSNGTYPRVSTIWGRSCPARLTRAILGTQLFGGSPAACCGPSCDFCQDESGVNSFMDLAIVSVFFPRSFSYKTPSAPTTNVFTPDER